ncbi:MAG TPA: ATP-binding protein [Solirubrobacteraceae bacterium]|jgi:anti-sigma regulatory factor (Ser/Thr protein kinase)|nr:ATP-binding protein [Solirubrobacteraceae bacterium]
MSSIDNALRLEVPCDVDAPGTVRKTLAAAHDGGWALEDGLLVASELVTNAVRHSGCMGEHILKVEVLRRHGHLMISVHDPGLSGDTVKPAEPEPADPGGRGLKIIELLSLRWGSERPDGYRVWAELAAWTPDR